MISSEQLEQLRIDMRKLNELLAGFTSAIDSETGRYQLLWDNGSVSDLEKEFDNLSSLIQGVLEDPSALEEVRTLVTTVNPIMTSHLEQYGELPNWFDH